MTQLEYLNLLFKKNKQCNCDYLTRLFYLDKKQKYLKNLCNDLENSLEEIHKGNPEVKELYYKKIYEFMNFRKEHRVELNSLIKKDKLKLFYHNEIKGYKKEPVSFEQGKKLKNKIITTVCSECSRQINVLK